MVSQNEINRQYRVLKQTLSAHARLRDGYALKANFVDCILLITSSIFCATTFASDGFFSKIGCSPSDGQFVLGIASVIAFICSMLLLFSGWREKAIKHRESADKWSQTLNQFRSRRSEEGNWTIQDAQYLGTLYWETDKNTERIPERKFNGLKSRHLRKKALSEMKSKYPGCPRVILALIIRMHDTKRAVAQK